MLHKLYTNEHEMILAPILSRKPMVQCRLFKFEVCYWSEILSKQAHIYVDYNVEMDYVLPCWTNPFLSSKQAPMSPSKEEQRAKQSVTIVVSKSKSIFDFSEVCKFRYLWCINDDINDDIVSENVDLGWCRIIWSLCMKIMVLVPAYLRI